MSTTPSTRNRLPTLFEVLSRRTLPPVDLFTFYVYMRDQQRSVDYLDFWLDVSQHMSLCRHYVRELRRSVLVSTPDLYQSGSRHSSGMVDHLDPNSSNMRPTTPSGMRRSPLPARGDSIDEKNHDQRLSAFLRSETLDNLAAGSAGFGARESFDNRATAPSSAFLSTPGALDDSTSPAHTIARGDIKASAQRILYTYLLRGSEREIVLPEPILSAIATAIEVDGRDDPEVFDEAKDYVFQAMERDAFPGFLRSKALGNLIPLSSLVRLIIGLLAVFAGFWAAFCLIFLDIKPRTNRLWLILPFGVGVYCLMAHQYSLDPIMALLGISEYTWMNFMRVREPYVRKLLAQRAIWILLLTLVIVAALVVLFALVPGKRL